MESISTYYDISFVDRLVSIKIKKNIFNLLTEWNESNQFYDFLNKIQYNTKVKALLFINEPETFDEVAYNDFLKTTINLTDESQIDNSPQFKDKDLMRKEITNLNQLVYELSKFKKICFTVLSGDIVTPFFGAALSMDFRYATPDMHFILAHKKYGLHPSGGLPYFLINQVGYLKAMEIMFSEKITAKEALEYGLINEIILEKDFMETVLIKINNIIQYPNCTLRRTKQLASFMRNNLDEYFLYEKSLLNL